MVYESVSVGERLGEFRNEAERMPPPVCRPSISSLIGYLNLATQMKGLAVPNPHFFGSTHALARYTVVPRLSIPICVLNRDYRRPACVHGATDALTIRTLDDTAKAKRSLPNVENSPPQRRRDLRTPTPIRIRECVVSLVMFLSKGMNWNWTS